MRGHLGDAAVRVDLAGDDALRGEAAAVGEAVLITVAGQEQARAAHGLDVLDGGVRAEAHGHRVGLQAATAGGAAQAAPGRDGHAGDAGDGAVDHEVGDAVGHGLGELLASADGAGLGAVLIGHRCGSFRGRPTPAVVVGLPRPGLGLEATPTPGAGECPPTGRFLAAAWRAARHDGGMRAVLQRARSASVTVDGEVVGAFDGEGLVILLGVSTEDTEAEAVQLAAKVAGLRILDGERSLVEASAPALVISQFTLYGDVRKGRRPSWSAAARGDQAEPLYECFAGELGTAGVRVERGVFGADMDVALTNAGPFTLVVDTADLAGPRRG